jgi:hypothetical protein
VQVHAQVVVLLLYTSTAQSNKNSLPREWSILGQATCACTLCIPPIGCGDACGEWCCSGLGLPTCRIDGATAVESRQDVVNAFNSAHASVRVQMRSRNTRHQWLQHAPAGRGVEIVATHAARLRCTRGHSQSGHLVTNHRLWLSGQVCLLSTRAGGAGLNLIGANHLVCLHTLCSGAELHFVFLLQRPGP